MSGTPGACHVTPKTSPFALRYCVTTVASWRSIRMIEYPLRSVRCNVPRRVRDSSRIRDSVCPRQALTSGAPSRRATKRGRTSFKPVEPLDARPILASAATRALDSAGAAVGVRGEQIGAGSVTVGGASRASALSIGADEVSGADGATEPAIVLAGCQVNARIAALTEPGSARNDARAVIATRCAIRAAVATCAAIAVIREHVHAGIAAYGVTDRAAAGAIHA